MARPSDGFVVRQRRLLHLGADVADAVEAVAGAEALHGVREHPERVEVAPLERAARRLRVLLAVGEEVGTSGATVGVTATCTRSAATAWPRCVAAATAAKSAALRIGLTEVAVGAGSERCALRTRAARAR